MTNETIRMRRHLCSAKSTEAAIERAVAIMDEAQELLEKVSGRSKRSAHLRMEADRCAGLLVDAASDLRLWHPAHIGHEDEPGRTSAPWETEDRAPVGVEE